jgi:23S rRNA (uracil1939-C5)-methyltransferase
VIEAHARWARAELRSIEGPSAARVTPACAYFAAGGCGGCAWQHVAIEAQRAAKQAIVAGALRRLVAAGLALRPLAAPVASLGWRWRARWTALGDAVGYRQPRGHQVTDIEACPQLTPGLSAVLAAARAARAGGALVGDGPVHAVCGPGGAHVVIEARCTPAIARLVGRADIRGAAWPGGAAGADAVELEPGLWVRGDGFAQGSAAGNAALVALVGAAAAVRPGERVLELHAGAGNFTRALVAAGADVIAVDDRAAVRPLTAPPRPEAGQSTGALEVRVAPAAAVVDELVRARRAGSPAATVDVVVLDPPRTGAREVMDGLAALAPRRVVYVACDPATFARDGAVLVAAGLAPRWAQALDMMPQTAHVELVAVFERA